MAPFVACKFPSENIYYCDATRKRERESLHSLSLFLSLPFPTVSNGLKSLDSCQSRVLEVLAHARGAIQFQFPSLTASMTIESRLISNVESPGRKTDRLGVDTRIDDAPSRHLGSEAVRSVYRRAIEEAAKSSEGPRPSPSLPR